jgi:hypothetical protein
MKCEHGQWEANVEVKHLSDADRWMAELTIKCAACGVPMRFIGLPGGLDLNGASVSLDATEARLAVAPKGEVVPAIEGPQGFSVRKSG